MPFGYYYFDPTMLILLPAILVSAIAQLAINSTYSRYSKVAARSGLTGAQAAHIILRSAGISYVSLEQVSGTLSDHYDPKSHALRLSQGVYASRSLAALGVAAHEAGHAIQHAQGFAPIRLRMALAPVVNIASYASWILLLVGALLAIEPLVSFGIILYCVLVLFQLVTLPVELDASRRALNLLTAQGILANDEIGGARAVLTAAAWTYVAALLSAVLQLLRLITIFGGRRNRR